VIVAVWVIGQFHQTWRFILSRMAIALFSSTFKTGRA
jgi:hypothetical protein